MSGYSSVPSTETMAMSRLLDRGKEEHRGQCTGPSGENHMFLLLPSRPGSSALQQREAEPSATAITAIWEGSRPPAG